MRSPPSCIAPVTAGELLTLLRRVRLLDAAQVARLAASWNDEDDAAPRLEELVNAGLLTPYQSRELLRGRLSRLRIGPYLLLQRIGSGGGGQVFKAEHALMKRLVALKVLKRSERPPAEAQTAARLSHPNIVAAYDATYHRGRLVVALEYAEGADLERLVQESGPLPVPLACEVVRQTTLALEYLHRRGLVHRDVKPANLVMTTDPGGVVRVKLLDLGLTCGVGDDELCGTLDYLAPERGLGEPADPRGDLYSLGCTFYHLLTGRVPYPGGNGPGKMLRHRLEEPVPVRQMRPEVPEHLVGLIAALMERDPERRLSEAATVRERLEPPPLAIPVVPPPRRRRALPILMVALVLGLLAGASARLAASKPPAPRPERSVVRSPQVPARGPANQYDLAAALAALPDDGTLTLSGDGPFRIRPITITGRRITVRAGPGSRPVIERVKDDDADMGPLFSTDSELTLIGLTLRDEGPTPLIAVRQGRALTLTRCELHAGGQAVSFEAADTGEGRVTINDSTLRITAAGGAAVVVWRAEPGPSARVEVALTGATVEAGRILACRALDGPIVVHEKGGRLTWRERRHSLDGYPRASPSLLRWETARAIVAP